MTDMHELSRFLSAQEGSYDIALAELRAGKKRSHWMWYIFPQIDGLGTSSTARFYAIKSREEAVAYLDHPVLGERLLTCCRALLGLASNDPVAVLGWPDNLKLRSCLTLFEAVRPEQKEFADLLLKFYGGERDTATLDILSFSE